MKDEAIPKGETVRRGMSLIAITGVLLFLLVVLLEHLTSPLDPATHEISEYVHSPSGWLMTAGFLAWAASLAATGMWVNSEPGGRSLVVALLMAALGMAITACFPTQTSAGRLPPGASLHVSGRLHDIGSGLTTIALLAAALLSLRLNGQPSWRRSTLALLACGLPAAVVLLVVGSDVAGIRQRVLVLVGCSWQLGLLTLNVRRSTVQRHP